ncbi:hypothetical protein C8Q73DRAFT_115855 [Cubamyces lactineus]|nr:hypothetical protein C8Q73DRAFT_115855 [Cubamyces lactineus]
MALRPVPSTPSGSARFRSVRPGLARFRFDPSVRGSRGSGPFGLSSPPLSAGSGHLPPLRFFPSSSPCTLFQVVASFSEASSGSQSVSLVSGAHRLPSHVSGVVYPPFGCCCRFACSSLRRLVVARLPLPAIFPFRAQVVRFSHSPSTYLSLPLTSLGQVSLFPRGVGCDGPWEKYSGGGCGSRFPPGAASLLLEAGAFLLSLYL